jgi:Caspase domain
MARIAIVIGVNKPQALKPLQGAASDARAFGEWIGKQGFDEVKIFADDQKVVAFADIFAEVNRVVKAATYSQLVIYFAGHGFQNSGSEVWLLSGAPDSPAEAISLEASVMAARESGLTSVVFISDACRSIPSGMPNINVFGTSIFPNKGLNSQTRPEVDRLFATLPSLVAVEAAQADDKARRGGVFTREFMQSYRDPPRDLIKSVAENGGFVEVVTNRKLKKLVRDMVEDAAFEVMPDAGQLPDFIVESDDAYVGRVERAPLENFSPPGRRALHPGVIVEVAPEIRPEVRPEIGPEIRPDIRPEILPEIRPEIRPDIRSSRRRPQRAPSVAALAREALDTAAQGQGADAAAAVVRGSVPGIEISDAIVRFSRGVPIDHFETKTGFSVTGARVISANSPHFAAEVLGTEFVRLQPENDGAPPASVLIQFEGGNGTVLPGLRGYIGHIFVDHGTVTNVNYVPSTNNVDRWREYQYVQADVEALRAAVAAAAGIGVFRIDRREAEPFADKIRELKVFDPTLGLYAAYAYASAGLEADVGSVLQSMRRDLNAELFDVAMLARRGVRPHEVGPNDPDPLAILPFCPMLRQGWSLLQVCGAQLPDAVRQAQNWLLPALWSTFAPEGVELLRQAMLRGDFR